LFSTRTTHTLFFFINSLHHLIFYYPFLSLNAVYITLYFRFKNSAQVQHEMLGLIIWNHLPFIYMFYYFMSPSCQWSYQHDCSLTLFIEAELVIISLVSRFRIQEEFKVLEVFGWMLRHFSLFPFWGYG
jgi:hypothetical protein